MPQAAAASPNRLWLAVAPAMLVPCAGALGYLVLFADSSAAPILYAATRLFLLAWPLTAALLLENWRPTLGTLRHLPTRSWLSSALSGLAWGLVMAVLILTAWFTLLRERFAPAADLVAQRAAAFHLLDHYLLFAVAFSLAHSLLEEYYWRWFVFGRLRRLLPLPAAMVLAALTFGAHHYVVVAALFGLGPALILGSVAVFAGAFWCRLYQRRRTLLACWISHAAADAALLWIGWQLLQSASA